MSRAPAPGVREGTILIVDDMPINLAVLVDHLESAGHQALVAQDAEDALKRARLMKPDLILLDVVMPGIDGFETCRRLKAAEGTRDIPVIFMTCLGEAANKLEGFEAGGVDYITKPFEIDEVLARIRTHLSLREAQKELEAKNAQLQHAHQELEQRVRERTAELATSNAALKAENAERRRAEDALRESQHLLQAIADNSTAVLYVKDLEGRYLMVNRRFKELFHVTEQSLLGKTDYDLFTTEYADAFRAFDLRVAAAGKVLEREEIVPQDDGVHTYISIKCPLFDESGRTYAVCGISTDISERTRTAAERERLLSREQAARAELERTGRLKDEFLALLSHELRTPLTAILGWSQLLLTRGPSDEIQRRGLGTIERNARTQAKLIDDLLDMSRIISGRLSLEMEVVDLAEMLETMLVSAEPAAKTKGIRLELNIASAGELVMGDPNRLQQIVWNLLSNSMKFTPQGGQVKVSLRREGSYAHLAVSDTGIGIDPNFLPYVFEQFRQEDASTTREHGGLGLGLSIVQHLVELHGGTVEAQSAGKDQGASFTVRLPLEAKHAEVLVGERPLSMPQRRPLSHRGGELLNLTGVRVLVVDDEPDTRELLLRILVECHAEVRTAGSVVEALAELIRDQPTVLVSDIGMPQEGGYELIQKVRQLPRERGGSVPALALTAFARAEDRARALLAGYQMHLAKPVKPSELVAHVASLAGRNHGGVETSPDGRVRSV
ncbi:response regulator [Polyangium jinanense]|uniref:histidine kinase n=1 Tax=Polyangium jinanense TaxID=2829994 RepID=A0A9X3XGL4_9BACT|nr:response regulator [Polyangium jinanense]MDC3962114.1 response regulator [Polyangium jinanense]MDC3988723.1 response regulator [Polyangium jinanense]